MRREPFRTAMASRTLILDAAMGTRLIAEGLYLQGDDPALWNLSKPEKVLAIHSRDRAAGADALTTNTFGANRAWLDRFGKADRMEEINRQAVAFARRVAGPEGYVIGDLGPTGIVTCGAIREQARILIDSGVDALLFETFQFDQAVPALQELADDIRIPRLVSLFVWPEKLSDATRELADLGAEVLGLNCRPGMGSAIEFAEKMRGVTPLPLLMKPSSSPTEAADREVESFALAVPRLEALGVKLIGGCCGTTELHVAALRNACYARASSPR